MTKKEKVLQIKDIFNRVYADAKCSLDFETPHQLLVAVQLSAQCTDARVNIVTPALFGKYPTPESMANAPLSDIEELIKTCGLYKTKAKDLIAIAQRICEAYGGKVPEEMDDLLTLSGVGRKTANLVRGDVFGHPAVVTDTHFIRLCNRLGFVDTKEPKAVEQKMLKILPPEKSNDFCHRSVLHGRAVCTARKAFCEKCCLNSICKKRMK